MRAIERLRRDHALLRSKLDVLESTVAMGPDKWFFLREVSFTLARQLLDHMRREETLIAACRKALDPAVLAHIQLEHRDEPWHLQEINRLFVTEDGRSHEHVAPRLTALIRGLRQHMAEEEASLFPALERALEGREDLLVPAQQAPSLLDEAMTVNRVLQEHPTTRPVFERLFIHIPHEGSTCLDEVAWRRGLESRELLERLEQVIGREDT